jgi:riboflavin synthase
VIEQVFLKLFKSSPTVVDVDVHEDDGDDEDDEEEVETM